MANDELRDILLQIASRVRFLFAERLVDAILFGSYARGDFNEESDIDIALLVDCTREEVGGYLDELAAIATDIGLEQERVVSFVCIPYHDYVKWLPALPFYQSIDREGVKLSA